MWGESAVRVVKAAEVRRAELIETGRQLFFAQGFDSTSVNEIILRAGISKGAFYHHFASKEALLEALAIQMAEASADSIGPLLADEVLNGFEKLQLFLASSRRLKSERADEILAMFHSLFRPENLTLYYRIHSALSAMLAPKLAQILEQGMADGSLLPADPKVMAELLIQLTATTHDAVADLLAARGETEFRRAAENFEARWRMQGLAVDRILGLPDGSLEFIDPGFAEAFFSGWRQSQTAKA